jgi:hypothetical protein
MTLTNNSTGFGQRNIDLSSNQCGAGNSFIALNSNTVINVDSLNVYNAAYPAVTTQPSYIPGSTVFVRAVVSDPFGSFDINGANIVITDPLGATAQPSTAMTQVADSGVDTRTYEFQYAVPVAGASGSWTNNVTAIEGTEGTVTDLGVNTFLAGTPVLSIMKLVSTFSDPVNATNPKAIPNAIVEYQISVTNTGIGPVDNNTLQIDDAIASEVQFYFGNPADPVQFVDGTPSSGLIYVFTNLADAGDDIAFSNDGGATFITPTVDAGGFDITVPPINLIRITPGNSFNGSVGGGDPGFTLRFRARVR